MYKIIYRKSAAKSLLKLPIKTASQVLTAFEQLSTGTEQPQLEVKKLQGREGYRLRIGGYRAIYRLFNEVMIIEVLKIGSRGDVYK
jgi:mRNA interferase RelE/StbE